MKQPQCSVKCEAPSKIIFCKRQEIYYLPTCYYDFFCNHNHNVIIHIVSLLSENTLRKNIFIHDETAR